MSKTTVFKFLIVSTITTLFCSCSNIEVAEQDPQNLFYKIYGGYYEESFTDMAICSNGNIKIAGTSGNYFDGTDLYYAEVNENGSVLNENKNQINTTNNIEGHDVYIASSDKELIVYSLRENNDSCSIFIVNTSATPSDIDTLSFDIVTDLLKSIKIINVSDSTIMLIAALTDNDGKDNICLYETNFSGKTELKLKQKLLYNIDSKQNLYTTVPNNGSIYAAISIKESDNKNNNIFVMSIKNYSMQWGFSYGTQSINEINSQIFINSNKLIVCATVSDSTDTGNIGLLEINTTDGTELSFKTIEESGTQTLSSATTNNKGNYVLVGNNTEKSSVITKLFFKELNSDFTVITNKTFGYENQSNAGKITYSTPNNCYYFAGTLNSNESIDIVLFKLNEKGEWIE